MKILHVIPGLNDPTCGIAVAAKLIARKQSREGHSVTSLDFRASELKRTAFFAEFDEIWVHSMWTPWVLCASFYALRAGRRLIRMPHGCMDPVKIRHHLYKKLLFIPIEKWLFSRASVIVGTIPEELDQIRAFVPGYKGEILHLPLSSCFSLPTSTLNFDSKQKHLRLLFIGRLHPLKGVEFLIPALSPEMKLVVIGKDEGELPKLKRLAEECHANVEFRGIVSEEEKNAALDACDVFVLPTLSENFGLVVAEALERGKRVITTDGAPAWAPPASTNSSTSLQLPLPTTTNNTNLIYLSGYLHADSPTRTKLLKEALQSTTTTTYYN